jgi:hypothetical protein
VRTSNCCTIYGYSCFYGNTLQNVTPDCPQWLEPVTTTIAADTIFLPSSVGCANAIARELGLALSTEEAPCLTCCVIAGCLSIESGGDLEYFTNDLGVLFNDDTEICFDELINCPDEPYSLTFTPLDNGIEAEPVVLEADSCATLLGGVIYSFSITGEATNEEAPDDYNIGWDCDTECAPNYQFTEITSFPAGFAFCSTGY